jgi:hypothetical protein
MMKMHIEPRPLHPLDTALPAASRPVVIERATGVLRVVAGRVWLTQQGDDRDWVLGIHDGAQQVDARRLVIESWVFDEPATIDWTPHPGTVDRVIATWVDAARRLTGHVGLRSRSCTIDRCPPNLPSETTILKPTFGAG